MRSPFFAISIALSVVIVVGIFHWRTVDRRIEALESTVRLLQDRDERNTSLRAALERLASAPRPVTPSTQVNAPASRPAPAVAAEQPPPELPVSDPPEVDRFLEAAHISAAKWRSLEQMNQDETDEMFRLSREIGDQSEGVANQRLSELEARYADRRKALLSTSQLEAYSHFSEQAEVVSQVAFANGAIRKLRHRY